MEPEDVESRLRAVQAQLEARRDAAKQALDEAWKSRVHDCGDLLGAAAEAHARYLEFTVVSEKSLPLLRSLAEIEALRRQAIGHLDRLHHHAEESRRQKESLQPSDVQTMATVPQLVGESFPLDLLGDEPLRLIRETRTALEAAFGFAPAPAPTPPAASPAPAPAPQRKDDVTLEEFEQAVTTTPVPDPPPAAAPLPEPAPAPESHPPLAGDDDLGEGPVGLPGDDELDAMFEEAMTAEDEPAPSEPPPEPAPLPEPEAPAPSPADFAPPAPEVAAPAPEPAPESGKDPLDELLTRAGFEG